MINGINYSAANVTVVLPIAGPVAGITRIEYSKEQAMENNYGLGQEPVSRGYGQNTYTGTITIYKDEWNRIIDASPLRDPTKLPPFDILVTFGALGVPFRTEVLKFCNFKNNPMGVGGGDTKIEVQIQLAIGTIIQ